MLWEPVNKSTTCGISDSAHRTRRQRTRLIRIENRCNTSLDYARKVRLALYARSGIPEVWIVNLTAEEVEVYQSPVGDSYTLVTRVGRSDTLTIGAIPGTVIPVADTFA
jgi:hypothetical protein